MHKGPTKKGSRKRLEWEGGLYWNDKHGPVILSDAIERCIQLGAQKKRRGKDMIALISCTEELEYDEQILNEADLLQACIDAGARILPGDWRPKFGRFTVEVC